MTWPRAEGYSIDGTLGEGGFGAVYKGVHDATGKTVAIKMILPSLADHRSVSLFQREISITQQLRHPNIVKVLDIGSSEGRWYYVMEYVDGGNLRNLVHQRGGTISLSELAPIMLEVLDGLTHAHRASFDIRIDEELKSFQGVVHRDLKPENILLVQQTHGYSAKVADFGLAKAFESAGLTVFTRPGEIAGTFRYWPREHLTHYKYLTPPSDVFSIASVLYESLSGYPIRDGLLVPSWREIIATIKQNPVVPIRKRNANILEPVAEVIDRALKEVLLPDSISQDEMREILGRLRYPDAGGFRNALAGVI